MSHRLKAFNLIEILVVLALIGILILISLPNHSSTIAKAKAVEAKTQLQHLHALQKMYFYEHSKYALTIDEVGFEQSVLTSNGGQANYVIALSRADQSGFVATATSVVDFDGDGNFNEWQVDENKVLKELIPD